MKLLSTSLTDSMLSTHNPLRGLTMARVISELEAGQRGELSNLQWLYHFIEKRDATLRGAKRRILSALLKLDWDIKIQADLDDSLIAKAEKQAEKLKAAYQGMKGFRAALRHLALAEFRGFAQVEKHFGEGGAIIGLEPVPQWHWCKKGFYGEWLFQENALHGGVSGVPITPENFLIREVEDPIDEIALIAFVRKSLSTKDFDSFIARYGIPFVFWVLSDQMAAALANDPTKMQEWMRTMRGIGADGEGIIPGGTLQTLDGGSSSAGKNPFLEHIGYQDEQIVMAATSGKLTMLSEATGIGGGATDAHQDTFDDIALALAKEISQVFHEQLDIPILAKGFPNEEPLCYFELAAKDAEDVGALVTNIKTLSDAGWEIDGAELSEKTGYTLTAKTLPQTPNDPGLPTPKDPKSKNRYNPLQPRDPGGEEGGRWIKTGGAIDGPTINFGTATTSDVKSWMETEKENWVNSQMSELTSPTELDDGEGWQISLADGSSETFPTEDEAQNRFDEERAWFESAKIEVGDGFASLIDDNGSEISRIEQSDHGWVDEYGATISNPPGAGDEMKLSQSDTERANNLFSAMPIAAVDVAPRKGGGFSFSGRTDGAEPYEIVGHVVDGELHIKTMLAADGMASLTGSSRGTGLLISTVEAAGKAGLNKITTTGGKGGSLAMTGYRTWPALGFDVSRSEALSSKLPAEIRGMAGDPPSLLDLTATKQGRMWWRKNGGAMDMEFNLSNGSASVARLNQVKEMLAR